MIPGKRFTLADGKDYVVPPLTFRQMKGLDDDGTTAKIFGQNAQERALAGFRMIHAALARNYAEVSEDGLQDLLDPGLVEAIVPVLFGKVKPEDRVAGKAPGQ